MMLTARTISSAERRWLREVLGDDARETDHTTRLALDNRVAE